jgi:transcriptional regulator CtsR
MVEYQEYLANLLIKEVTKMPTQEEAKLIYDAIKKNGKYYDRLNDTGKKAYWQYMNDQRLIKIDKLNDKGKAEYQKYVDINKPEYAMQASIVEKPKQYIQTQNEKVMSAITPGIVKNMASQSPEQIATKRVESPITTADKRRLLNERMLAETDVQTTTGKAGIAKVPTAKTNMIPVGKAGIVKTPAREFNSIDAALLGALDTTTLGALNIKDDAAIKENKGAFTAGQIGGYIAPGAGLTNAAGKGLAKLGAGKLLQNLGGSAIAGATIDTGQGLVAGDTGADLAKRVGRGAVIGLAADGALMGLGKIGQGIMKKLADKQTLSAAEKAVIDNLPEEAKKEVILYVDTYGNVRKTPTTDLQLEAPKQNLPMTDEAIIASKKKLGLPTDKITKTVGSPASEVKPLGDINTQPIANKPPIGALNAQSEAAVANEIKPSELKKNWKKFYSATVNNTQATADVSKEAEIMSNVARNSGATVDTIIKKGLVNMEGKPIEGKAVSDIFNMSEKEAQALEDLLFETHNIDRVKQGKELTSRTTEESKLIIDNIKKQYPHLEEKAKEVNILLKNLLDEWGVKSGLVDTDLRNLVQGMYKNYVPGYRELAGVDATSFKSRGMGPAKIINKAIGGDDKLMSLQKSIPMLINKTVKAARKNELYREILRAAENGSPYAKVLEPAGKIEEVVQKNATDTIIESIKADGIDALANITDSALTADPKLGYLLTVMDNGKPVKLQIREELFKSLQALNGKGDDDLQAALKLFKKGITNPFKSLITGYNPLFAVRNFARDIPTAYIQGTENNPFKFARNLGSAAKDMFKKAPEFQEYKALGGEGGNYFNVEKGIKAAGKLEKILKPLGAINNFTETLPRYAEYKGTIKREGTGYATKMKALSNAQEVTVNFGRHGDVTKAIDAVVPYLNPAVQGLDKTARTFKKPEAWVKALGVITVPTAAIYAINQVVDKKGYDQLDNRTKDTYFVFALGDGKFAKVSKTRESGALFGALFERILRQVEGQPEAFKGYSNTIKNNFLIQNPWTDNIASAAVTGLKFNKDFAGRAVVPNYMLMDKRSPRLQFDERTSEIAKEIGDKFNLSPKQIDYIIKSYTGIVGSILIPATTKGGNVLESAVVRPFTADAAYNNEVTNNFYMKLDKLKQAATDKNITMKLPSKLVTPEEQMSNLYASMTSYISDIRDGITQLGSTDEAREKQQQLLNILQELNKDIPYKEAERLKAYLNTMAKEYKK